MKNKTLNEQVSRIKNMMGLNESFGRPGEGESKYEQFLDTYDDEIRTVVSKLSKVKYSDLESIPEDEWEMTVNDVISTYGEKVIDVIQHWVATEYFDKHELGKFAIQHHDETGTEPQMVIFAIEDFLKGIGKWFDEDDDIEIDN